MAAPSNSCSEPENLQLEWLPTITLRTFSRVGTIVGSGLACGLVSGVIGMGVRLVAGLVAGPHEALAFVLIGGLIGGLLGALGETLAKPRPVEVIQFNWVEIRSRMRRAIRSGLIVGLIVAFCVGLVFLLLVGPREGLFGSSPKSVIEVEVSSMQRLASEVGGMNPRFI